MSRWTYFVLWTFTYYQKQTLKKLSDFWKILQTDNRTAHTRSHAEKSRTMTVWVVLTNVQDVHFREFDCTNRSRGYKRVLLTPLTIRIVGKVGSTVSREPSSIFILSEEDYNSPAATFSNLLHGPAVVARPRERRQLRRLVGRVALTLSPSRENVRSAKVESRSVSRHAGVVPAQRQGWKASAAHRLRSLSGQLLIQYSFPYGITFHLHASCPTPSQPFVLFATTLLRPPHSPLFLLFLPVTAFSTSELSYLPTSRPRAGKCRHVLHNIEIFWYPTPTTWVLAILWYIKSRAPSRELALNPLDR